MVYHGQLDRHRGVLALPIFLQNIRNSRLDVRLIMVGMGDCFNRLQMMAEENEHFEIHSTLPQPKLAQLLSQCHIGLLPMPENKIWAIASPLKRSEYAASGLLIYGIDHAGHRFSTNDSMDWMKLVRQEEFHEKGIQWLQELQPELREQLGLQARTYAEENLSWENSVDSLEQCIVSLTDKVL
jgi:glycosyltransferase involved in cell wall biosynthesis